MKTLLILIIGIAVGIGAYKYMQRPKPANTTLSEPADRDTNSVSDSLKRTFDTDKIKEELKHTGQVIREKSREAGNAIADAAANAKTTTLIKAKLIEEPNLSAMKIDVDTTDGVVTLSGTVKSHEQIVRAMDIAYETEGVYKVVSTLQVKPE